MTNVWRAFAVLALVVASAGCLESSLDHCANGLICGAGEVCDDTHGGCVDPDQLRVCQGQPERAACETTGVPDGLCFDEVCLPPGCGNRVLEDGEMCDDGNLLHQDGCSADCTSDETCGNGIVDIPLGENCDDGNTESEDGCQWNCVDPRCGDGFRDPFEGCDAGEDNSDAPGAACRSNCQPGRCGDMIEDPGEVCDDGNLLARDGCTPDCLSDETCPNGYVDFLVGELCDGGDSLSHDGCERCALEAPRWRKRVPGPPLKREGHAMVYDAAHRRVILFGGFDFGIFVGDTLEWDGAVWRTVVTPAAPTARRDHAMAYDAARGVVVLFGGQDSLGIRGDTWEWDGLIWRDVTPLDSAPPRRRGHAMAYDAANDRVVLFGGTDGIDLLGDTWTWDGTTWVDVSPATSPDPRIDHALAYDAARGELVLHGGDGGALGRLGDTWIWNGATWTDAAPATTPPERAEHAMAYDPVRQRIVMVGGYDSVPLGDTWEWDGTDWQPRTLALPAPERLRHAIAYDAARGRLVLFGGKPSGFLDFTRNDTWELDGVGWVEVPPPTPPPGRHDTAMATDPVRARVVLFGGSLDAGVAGDDTWEWDGARWYDVSQEVRPPGRFEHALATDASGKGVLLFGGVEGGINRARRGDTWQWDGSAWAEATPASSPSARSGHALAFDTVRRRVVLFGGEADSGLLADTWEWDGSTWTERTPVLSPPARQRHALAYDAVRARVVLSGGIDYSTAPPLDVWEWDGNVWTQSPAEPAGEQYSSSLAYDAARRRVVLVGGTGRIETREWDGTGWLDLTPDEIDDSPNVTNPGFAADPARGELVLFGGLDIVDGLHRDDTWIWRHERDAVDDDCSRALDRDGDAVAGCADDDCWALCTPLCAPAAACDPAAPHCGDGVCSQLESAELCPADC